MYRPLFTFALRILTKKIMSNDELSAAANELLDVLEMYLQKKSQEEEVC